MAHIDHTDTRDLTAEEQELFDGELSQAVEEVLDAWRPVHHTEMRNALVEWFCNHGMMLAARMVAEFVMPADYQYTPPLPHAHAPMQQDNDAQCDDAGGGGD